CGTPTCLGPATARAPRPGRRRRRRVRGRAERHESFVPGDDARDRAVKAERALDAEGRILAFRSENTSNCGAHAVSYIPLTKGVGVSTSVYRVPCSAFRARAVLSNTTYTSPYRAAGRPEVMFVIERLLDLAARKHGLHRPALRS